MGYIADLAGAEISYQIVYRYHDSDAAIWYEGPSSTDAIEAGLELDRLVELDKAKPEILGRTLKLVRKTTKYEEIRTVEPA